jgi:hypothetical protein
MRREVICAASAAAALLAGCAKKDDTISTAPAVEASAAAPSAAAAPASFSQIDQSLKSGSFDDAAARLLEMRTVRTDFTPQEAAEYRRKMNEAYSAALEAAEKGDPRAKAAIEMIRANPGR